MIAQKFGGRGGGKDRLGQGGLGRRIGEEEFVRESLNIGRELFK